MNRFILIFCSFLASTLYLSGFSQIIDNKVFKSDIRTPLAFPSGNPLGYPMLELYSTTPIEFHFDLMGTERNDYRYAVYHCDHNWNVSDLTSNEYLSGFSVQDINDIEYSFNTEIEFLHYTFQFPNDLSKPTRSGNYGVIVFDGEDPFTSQVATFRMIVFENLVQINGVVNNSSSVGDRFKRQEIDFDISHAGFQINAPLRDVKVVILQNGDWSSSVRGLAPTFIKQNQLIYDYNGPNNFDGGSEWRFFEVKSLKFASIQVEGLMMEPDGWHAYLRRDLLRGGKAYQTEFDINGKFFIRNDLGEESHLDAEYIWVHFKLDSPPILDAIVELETSESRFKPELFKLEYDMQEKAYAKKILMKQGYYNYRYKLRDLYHPNGDLSITEGNHSETENDYHIITYFFDRQFGGDRIIGVSAINSIAR
jgi:hypothetical protein